MKNAKPEKAASKFVTLVIIGVCVVFAGFIAFSYIQKKQPALQGQAAGSAPAAGSAQGQPRTGSQGQGQTAGGAPAAGNTQGQARTVSQ